MATRKLKKINKLKPDEAIAEMIALENGGHQLSKRYLEIRKLYPNVSTKNYRANRLAPEPVAEPVAEIKEPEVTENA